MSDLKTCPFCLEEIPARAIKCKFCESMIDESPSKTADVSQSSTPTAYEETKQAQATKSTHYQSFSKKERGKRNLVALVVGAVLLLFLGAGLGYWFLLGDTGVKVAEGVENDDILGSWKGTTGDEEIYFEFMPNKMVRIAVPAEGYWFRTEYRLVEEENISYLELYHRGTEEWERNAELAYKEPDLLVMTDTWDGIVIELESYSETEVGEVFRDLRFER